MGKLALEPATDATIDAVRSLLHANELPVDDIDTSAGFVLARSDGDVVGCGGLEVYDTVGLLRSVAVAGDHRGQGYGRTITHHLEQTARQRGVSTLYLLTTTAAPFFASLGYASIDRSAVPDAIRATREFAELCPDTATCMTKEL